MAMVKRGEIWLAAFDSTTSSEIRKTRPCIIISPPEMHEYLRTAIVAPMTTGSRPAPFRIPIQFQRKAGVVLLDQLRTLDKRRLVKRLGRHEVRRWMPSWTPCRKCLRRNLVPIVAFMRQLLSASRAQTEGEKSRLFCRYLSP